MEKLGAFLFIARGDGVSQPIQCLPERKTPFLIPSRAPAGVAATIAVPAFDAVRAAPGRALPDFGFHGWTMAFKVLTVVCEFGETVRFYMIERVSQRHIASRMMVPVSFAVGCDMDELRPGPLLVGKRRHEPRRQVLAAFEQPFKGDCLRNRPII